MIPSHPFCLAAWLFWACPEHWEDVEDRPGPGGGTGEGCWTPRGISDVWEDPSWGGGDGVGPEIVLGMKMEAGLRRYKVEREARDGVAEMEVKLGMRSWIGRGWAGVGHGNGGRVGL